MMVFFVFVWDLFVIVILFFLITVMRVMGLMSNGLYIQVLYLFFLRQCKECMVIS